ncbi:MAG: GAF domain-containing protein, partial [Burkholderiales bacterium]
VARERQTATAEVLKVIAGSPSDVQPVFDAIASSSNRLLGGYSTMVARIEGVAMHLVAFTPTTQEGDAALRALFPLPMVSFPPGGPLMRGEMVPITETEELTGDMQGVRDTARARGFRSAIFCPLRRDGQTIGMISVTRREPGPFAPHQVELLKTFADQAVIAIQNARLFNETQEALAHQTASADILRVISSSPTDVQPVFDAIVTTAVQRLGCDIALVQIVNGDTYSPKAMATPAGLMPVPGMQVMHVDPDANFPSQAIVGKRTLHVRDWSAIPLPPHERMRHEQLGLNCALHLPMLRGDACLGVLLLGSKKPDAFNDKAVALAESFRDQAVIAIQNARLFNETQEALERQTATADILKVIASSPSDVQPVFDAIAASSNRLMNGFATSAFRIVDGDLHLVAFTPVSELADEVLKASFPMRLSDNPVGARIVAGEVVQVTEIEMDWASRPDLLLMARKRGFRSAIWTPMMRDGVAIGMISVTRREPGPFAAHSVALLQTFADQAAIAIENVRLFTETEEALEQQTATAEVLQVISGSMADARPVFEAIMRSCRRLFNVTDAGVGVIHDDGQVRLEAHIGETEESRRVVANYYPVPVGESMQGLAVRRRAVLDYPDVLHGDSVPWGLREIAERIGRNYSCLVVPMLWQDRGIGAIHLTRFPPPGESPPGFSDREIELLRTFADQAVIAIQNARMFTETKEALERQTATAEILRVLGGSMTDTQPVFDAIVKNCSTLLNGSRATLWLIDDDRLHARASTGTALEPIPFDRGSAIGACMLERRVISLSDLEKATEEYPRIRNLSVKAGYRSGLYAPL